MVVVEFVSAVIVLVVWCPPSSQPPSSPPPEPGGLPVRSDPVLFVEVVDAEEEVEVDDGMDWLVLVLFWEYWVC